MAYTKIMASAFGGFFAALVAIAENADFTQTVIAGGLGACLSVILVRWILSQYNQAIMRLSKLEDERAIIIRETVTALTKTTDEISSLIAASEHRGQEVRELVTVLKNRPCLKDAPK